MSTIKVLNMAGAEVGTVELCDSIFGIEPNQAVVHEVVKNHLANCRQGTQSALTLVGQVILNCVMDSSFVGFDAKHSFGQFDLANQLAGHIVNIRLKHDLRSPFLSLLRKPSGDFCRKPSAGSC